MKTKLKASAILRATAMSLAVLMLGGALASCGGKTEGVTITAYNWSGYIDDELCRDFEKATGIKVKYDTFDTNEVMYANVSKNPSAYDVLFPSEYMIQRMIQEGLLDKVDKSNIPNLKYIDEYFLNRISVIDPGNEYMVPYMWGTVGIAYDSASVDPADADTWRLLWNEKYKKRIFMLDSVRDSIGVTLKLLGYSLNTTNPAELSKAKDLLLEQKPLTLSYEGETVKDKIVSKEGDIAVVYSGDALYIKQEMPTVEFSVPLEGSNVWFDGMVIPAGAKHKKEAEMFINFITDPKISAQQSEKTGYSSANREALQYLPAEIRDSYIYWPDQATLDRCEMFIDLGDFKEEYDKTWEGILIH